MSFVNLNITIIQSASLSRPSSLSVSLCGQPQDLHPLSSLSLSPSPSLVPIPSRSSRSHSSPLCSPHLSFLRSSLPPQPPFCFTDSGPALKFQISFNRIGYVPAVSFADDASSTTRFSFRARRFQHQASIRIVDVRFSRLFYLISKLDETKRG